MPWFKVDDHFHSHRKVKKCGLEVVGLWTVAGSYCMAHLTDGFVEEWFVKEWPRGMRLAGILVRHGLWLETEKDGEKGWQFHDWDKYQPTKAQVEEERARARKRKAQQRLSQGESHRDSHRDSHRESQGESRGTPGTVPDLPARPSLSLVTSGEDLSLVGTPEPPIRCPKHINEPNPPQCGGCGEARLFNKAWKEQHAKVEKLRRRNHWAAVDACSFCDDNGMREVAEDRYERCDHQAVQHA